MPRMRTCNCCWKRKSFKNDNEKRKLKIKRKQTTLTSCGLFSFATGRYYLCRTRWGCVLEFCGIHPNPQNLPPRSTMKLRSSCEVLAEMLFSEKNRFLPEELKTIVGNLNFATSSACLHAAGFANVHFRGAVVGLPNIRQFLLVVLNFPSARSRVAKIISHKS